MRHKDLYDQLCNDATAKIAKWKLAKRYKQEGNNYLYEMYTWAADNNKRPYRLKLSYHRPDICYQWWNGSRNPTLYDVESDIPEDLSSMLKEFEPPHLNNEGWGTRFSTKIQAWKYLEEAYIKLATRKKVVG